MMNLIGRPGINIERNPHLPERLFDHCMILVDDLLRAYLFFQCPDRDLYTVFVAAANKFDVSFLRSLIANINVSRNIDAGQMTDVNRPVGIGASSSDQVSFKLIHPFSSLDPTINLCCDAQS